MRKTIYLLSMMALMSFSGCYRRLLEPAVLVPKIACIGTSITEGYILPVEQTYPYLLQGLEKAPAMVLNYGVGGTTLLTKGEKPYRNEQKYQFAVGWNPTVVVMEFGTNDSKALNWQYKSEFKKDYLALIDTFRKLPSAPTVYLCVPTPAFSENFEVQPGVIANEIVPLIYEIAKEANAPTIDFYNLMLTKSALFPDGIHPNAAGASMLANEVYRVINLK